MSLTTVFVFLLMGCTLNADFVNSLMGYKFIFHDETNLLLIKGGGSCYYVDVPDVVEHFLSDERVFFVSPRFSSESMMLSNIAMEVTTFHTTLTAMRNKYQDLLADFHCLDKKIYELIWHPGK